MTEKTKQKLSESMKRAWRTKRMSRAMRASWARRKEVVLPIPHSNPTADAIDKLYTAAAALVDENELKAAMIDGVSSRVLCNALAAERSAGTSLQARLRDALTIKINTALDSLTASSWDGVEK
jgi:hypothetical protein